MAAVNSTWASLRRWGLPLGLSIWLGLLILACGDDTPTPTSPNPAASPAPPTPPVEPPSPDVPANLRVAATGHDFIEWRWDAVPGADGYRAQFSENEAFTDSDPVVGRTSEQISYRREDLAPQTSVYLRVQSFVGTTEAPVASPWSLPVTGATGTAPSPGLLLAPPELILTEGETALLMVRLTTQPMAPVIVAVSHAANAEQWISVPNGSRLLFERNNWDVEQTVILEAKQNRGAQDRRVAIFLDTVSEDLAYAELPRLVVLATILDDDPVPVYLSRIGVGGERLYDGQTSTRGLNLGGRPTGPVIVTTTSSDTGLVAVTAGARLTFLPDNYDIPQAFSLTVVREPAIREVTITHAASGGGYDGVYREHTNYWNSDGIDDIANVLVSPMQLAIHEGERTTVEVKLATLPVVEVTVVLTSVDVDAVTIAGGVPSTSCWTPIETCAELRFTRQNGQTAQSVTVAAEQDEDANDESVFVILRAHSERFPYAGLGTTLAVRVYDDESPVPNRR